MLDNKTLKKKKNKKFLSKIIGYLKCFNDFNEKNEIDNDIALSCRCFLNRIMSHSRS